MQDRWDLRSRTLAGESRSNPLIALHCGAGGGKSFFLDYVANNLPKDFLSAEMRSFFADAIIVNITFNGQQSAHETLHLPVGVALAWRVLHSYVQLSVLLNCNYSFQVLLWLLVCRKFRSCKKVTQQGAFRPNLFANRYRHHSLSL